MPATPAAHSDAKRNERVILLCETASNVCTVLSDSSPTGANPTRELFYYKKESVRAAVDDYFDLVDAFKEEHYFDDHLINAAKQAALSTQVIMNHNIIQAHRNVPNTVHLGMANSWYAYRVAMNLLNLRLDQVEDDIADEVMFHIRFGYDNRRTTILIYELARRACKGRRWTRFIPSFGITKNRRKPIERGRRAKG